MIKKPEMPSNKKFGLFFSFIFFVIGIYFFIFQNLSFFVIFILLFFVTINVTFFAVSYLLPFNKLWFNIGLLLGKIISPIVLGVIFFLLLTPISLVMRLVNRDELKLNKNNLHSYWILRNPPGPEPETFKNQF